MQPALEPRATNQINLVVLSVAGAVAVTLHVLAGHGFPVPWSDEVDFVTPAVALARHGTLHVPQLGASHGMFWMSDLYYLLLAPALRLGPATIDTARMMSLVAVLVAAGGFWVAGTRFGAGRLLSVACVAVWVASPHVVIAGNMARHEAMVLAFVAWSLAATADQKRVLAVSLAGFAAVLHPAGIAFAAVIVAANIYRRGPRTRTWEWVVLACLGGFLLFEFAHFAANASLALHQLRFQAARKAAKHTTIPRPIVGSLVLVGMAAVATFRRAAWWPSLFLATIAGTGGAVYLIGHEMWYRVYGFETAALCGALALGAGCAGLPRPQRARVRATLAAMMAVFVYGVIGYNNSFYGMRIRQHSQEWNGFVADVRAELQAVDATSIRGRTVVISKLSGLPWPAEADAIGHLRIVKQTLVTDPGLHADYLLFARTLCCDGSGKAPPAGDVVVHITSAHQTFDATLIDLRASDRR